MTTAVDRAIEMAVKRGLCNDPVIGNAVQEAWSLAKRQSAVILQDLKNLLGEIQRPYKRQDVALSEEQRRGLDAAEAVRLDRSGHSRALAEEIASDVLLYWQKRRRKTD